MATGQLILSRCTRRWDGVLRGGTAQVRIREDTTSKPKSRDIREVQVSEWWRSGAISTVVTTEGRSLKVLYPGRPSPHAGPDFRDTLLITEEGELVRGDTEVHLRRRDWDGHGHRGDPRYGRVVLHLFMRGGGNAPKPSAMVQEAVLGEVPEHTDTLGNGAERSGSQHRAAPLERIESLPAADLEKALDQAGERRFLGMTCSFVRDLRGGDAQSALYAGIMEALGYSQNSAPMGLLARGLPLRSLREMAGPTGGPFAVEAILLGAAGLFHRQLSLYPEQPDGMEGRYLGLEKTWEAAGAPEAVPEGMWSNAGLRPQNRPARRLAGAAALIVRYGYTGLLEGLEGALQSGGAELERALVVEAREGESPGSEGDRPGARPPALIGRSRAREIIINVLLPLYYARAHLLGDPALAERCRDLYRSLPPGQDNEVTREMKSLLGDSPDKRIPVKTARRQQGLIHLYRVLKGQAK